MHPGKQVHVDLHRSCNLRFWSLFESTISVPVGDAVGYALKQYWCCSCCFNDSALKESRRGASAMPGPHWTFIGTAAEAECPLCRHCYVSGLDPISVFASTKYSPKQLYQSFQFLAGIDKIKYWK